jgi:ligand-binding sensor domain-containing protein/signal transduction histidine kinase
MSHAPNPLTLTVCWLLGLICLLPPAAPGQDLSSRKAFGRYQQYVWRLQQGLPQNSVNAFTGTRDGYLWLATFEGVARFDGVRFTVFDHSNTPAFKSNQIMALLEDRAGDLWLGTNGGGLIRRSHDAFRLYTTSDGLSNNFVRALAEDAEGNLWIGTEGGGLNRFRDGHFEVYTARQGLPDDYVHALRMDPEGGMWIGTVGGLAHFKGGRFMVYTIHDGLPVNSVTALCLDRAGVLWVGTKGGLSRLEKGRFVASGLKRENASVSSLYEDRDFHLWVGSFGGGLALWKQGAFSYQAMADGLPGEDVLSIYQDPEGDMWIGTAANGVCQFRAGRFDVYAAQDGLPDDKAKAIFQDSAGALWVGTINGLARLQDGSIRVYSKKDGLPEGHVLSIAQDQEGTLWVESGEGKLCRLRNGRFTVLPLENGQGPPRAIVSLLGDREGNLWVGTGGGGLNRFRNGLFTPYTRRDGLADDHIMSLYEDREGGIWVGTLRGGISRFKDGRISSWTTADGLASNQVLCFYEDRRGSLWIGTADGGLSRFRDGKFANIAVKDGLYNDLAFQILSDTDDDSGSLWMSCNKGVYRVSLRELDDFADGRRKSVNSYVYGEADGMLSRECNGSMPAGWKTRDGRLWFSTVKGVVAIDPKLRDLHAPRIAIEQVTVDGAVMPAGGPIEMKPGQESLEIQYTALESSRPRQIRFRYRLESLDARWIEAGTRRTAYYSHLPPGRYTFRIMADNGEGVWNSRDASLALTVEPPFYRSWWFRGLLALGICCALIAAYRYRLRRWNQAQLARQAFAQQLIASQESERKRIAAELHDSLGQRLLIMKNLALLELQALTKNGTQAEKLEEISAEASRALSEVREISYALRPYQLDRLGLTKAIEAVVRNAAKASPTAITADLDNIDNLFPEETRINLYRIVQEGLNNIIKHADATEASVTIRRTAAGVRLSIRDNGKGFTPAASGPSERGFGLTGIAERVQLLGGKTAMHSAPGKGSEIGIEFPLAAIRNGGSGNGG